MHPPIGPSLHLVLLTADILAEVTSSGLRAAWERWVDPQRWSRKLNQFAQSGWTEDLARTHNTERIVRLTDAGRSAALGGRNPEEFWRRPWDGRWRLVLFDVPESQYLLRDRLRRKLRSLAFGYLQRSVWISPDGVDTLRQAIDRAQIDVESLSLMDARPCAGETDADLVAGAWDFRRINRNYEIYCQVLNSAPSRLSSVHTRRTWLEIEWRAWCHAIRNDPLLPEALLPASYRGREAWRRRNQLFRHLLRMAQRA